MKNLFPRDSVFILHFLPVPKISPLGRKISAFKMPKLWVFRSTQIDGMIPVNLRRPWWWKGEKWGKAEQEEKI